MAEEYEEQQDCVECGRETPHLVVTGTHERDSSGDSAECLVCGTRKDGWGHTLDFTRPSYRARNQTRK